MGMPPGMPPEAGMGMPPGMPPEAGMGMPPGMPPEAGMGMPPEINPQFMGAAAGLDSQEVFDAASVAALLKAPELTEIAANYMPAIEKALDNVGRILLSVQMNEGVLTERMGIGEYTKLEANLKQVLTGLGSLIMGLNEQMTATQEAFTTPVI